jgi:hypothetical protein
MKEELLNPVRLKETENVKWREYSTISASRRSLLKRNEECGGSLTKSKSG